MDDELAAIRARKLAEMQRLAQAPARPVPLTEASLPGFVAQHGVAVVDCWAAWCGPCKLMEPVLDALAQELRGRVAFGKLNVDEEPRAAERFAVQSIPTLLVFRRGRLADRVVGALPAGALRQRLGV